MRKICEVKKPGLATSVQDMGRTGYQQYGVVTAGAMDSFALQVGNLLVGNSRNSASLEIALMGPELEVMEDTVIAVTGADLSATLDGRPLPTWKSVLVNKGQVLSFGKPINGGYAYISFAGSIDVPEIMGSKSTYTKASLGGFKGRNLQKGDFLEAGSPASPLSLLKGRGIAGMTKPDYHSKRKIRVVAGPDCEYFSKDSMDAFFDSVYTLTAQSDRMGYRLEGPAVSHIEHADILSDAILPGTIQVPSDGQPIILLADRQTTGGYARIATVATVDLPMVTQKVAGDELQFEEVSLSEAQKLYVEQEIFLRKLSLSAKC